jgi:hypothetical protein
MAGETLYEATLTQLGRRPAGCRVGLVLRHSERQPILRPEDTYTAMLTEHGIRQAEAFGRALARIRQPGRMYSSPIERCRDTVAAIGRGAAWAAAGSVEHRLSHPFIAPAWNALPILWQKDPMPTQVAALMDLVLEREEKPGVVDIFCTHDTIVAALAGYFMGCAFNYPGYWPDYLEGVFIWRQEGAVHVRWREYERVIGLWPVPAIQQLRLAF